MFLPQTMDFILEILWGHQIHTKWHHQNAHKNLTRSKILTWNFVYHHFFCYIENILKPIFNGGRNSCHGLSQQGVWVSIWTPKPLKSTPQDTPQKFRGILKNVNPKHVIEYFHLHIIPMALYKDIMPYSDKFIHVYGWNLSILWSPFKIWTPKNFTIANFLNPG